MRGIRLRSDVGPSSRDQAMLSSSGSGKKERGKWHKKKKGKSVKKGDNLHGSGAENQRSGGYQQQRQMPKSQPRKSPKTVFLKNMIPRWWRKIGTMMTTTEMTTDGQIWFHFLNIKYQYWARSTQRPHGKQNRRRDILVRNMGALPSDGIPPSCIKLKQGQAFMGGNPRTKPFLSRKRKYQSKEVEE